MLNVLFFICINKEKIMPKNFHPGVVLTIIQDICVCPNPGLSDVQSLLKHLTGQDVYTDQIPDAMKQVAPHLRAAFPFMCEYDLKSVLPLGPEKGIAEIESVFGTEIEVSPLPAGTYQKPAREVDEVIMQKNTMIAIKQNGGGKKNFPSQN